LKSYKAWTRRSYLNKKFGRSGDLNKDINERGSRASKLAANRIAVSSRRSQLNKKYGRSGDLNKDINRRENRVIAENFFKSKGYEKERIDDYIMGIDLDKSLSVEVIGSGKKLWQYQVPDGKQGNWYSISPKDLPTKLGINSMGESTVMNISVPKIQVTYQTTQRIEVLRSTSARAVDKWSIPKQPFQTEGGARQLFSNNKTAFSKITLGSE